MHKYEFVAHVPNRIIQSVRLQIYSPETNEEGNKTCNNVSIFVRFCEFAELASARVFVKLER